MAAAGFAVLLFDGETLGNDFDEIVIGNGD